MNPFNMPRKIFLYALILLLILTPSLLKSQGVQVNNYMHKPDFQHKLVFNNNLETSFNEFKIRYRINHLILNNNENDEFTTTSRIVSQIGVGTATGLLGGLAGTMFGYAFKQDCEKCLPNVPSGTFSCGLVGWIIGTALGIDYIGKTHSYKSNFLLTLGGSFVGMIGGISLTYKTKYGLSSLFCPSLCGTIAFNLTAKKKK